MSNHRFQSPSVIAMSLSLVAAALTALPAHADFRAEPNENAWLAANPVHYEIIEAGDGPFLEPLEVVVTSEAQWDDLMAGLVRDSLLFLLPAPPAPSGVNWEREAIILVSMGQFREFHCYVNVKEVRRISYRALCAVHVHFLPGPRNQTVTSPYFVAKFDKRGVVRSAAARFEIHYSGMMNSAAQVTYSDREAFTSIDPHKSPLNVAWGELKSLLSKF